MAIRIYALAQELKVGNQDVRAMCSKLNIVSKGSSILGSIADEDAARIREYFKSGTVIPVDVAARTFAKEKPVKNDRFENE